MNKPAHFPSVRLVVAGLGSVFLLAWLAFIPGASPLEADPREKIYPVGIVCTVLLALCILVVLGPVFWHGPCRDRWLAVLVTVFPLLTFIGTLLWFAERVLP